MAYRTRIYYTYSQKAEIRDRWQRGETLHSIACYLTGIIRLLGVRDSRLSKN